MFNGSIYRKSYSFVFFPGDSDGLVVMLDASVTASLEKLQGFARQEPVPGTLLGNRSFGVQLKERIRLVLVDGLMGWLMMVMTNDW